MVRHAPQGTYFCLVKARKCGQKYFLKRKIVDVNAHILNFGALKFLFGAHKSLNMGNFERTKVCS